MARILTAGNELGDWAADGLSAYQGVITSVANQRFSAISPGNNGGQWSFYLTSGQGLEYDFEPDHPGGIGEFYFRCHMHMGNRTDGTWERLRFSTSAGALLLRFATVDGGSGASPGGLWYPAIYNSAGALLLANTTTKFRNSEWNLIELHVKLDAAVGRVELWINKFRVFDYTGPLVGGGGEALMYRFRPNYTAMGGGLANSTYYDDMAINDLTGTVNNGRVGEGWVVPVRPSGNGSSSQLTNAFGGSVDNFKFVNKILDLNPSGLVGTSTASDKDLYALQSMPDEFSGINVLKGVAYAVRNGPSITKAKLILKPTAQAEIDLPSGVGIGVSLPAGSPAYVSSSFETNPNSSNEPFTKAELDGMEAGIQFIA